MSGVAEKARELAGNWQAFPYFIPGPQLTELPHGEQWAVVYLTNRDADYLTRSNARVILGALRPFLRHGRDAQEAGSSHWACGTVDGVVIRVYTPCGRITRAFATLADLLLRQENYPILDEDDASEEEAEEAREVWANCYNPAERIAFLRKHDAEFRDFADMLGCVRGKYPPYTNDGWYPLVGGLP